MTCWPAPPQPAAPRPPRSSRNGRAAPALRRRRRRRSGQRATPSAGGTALDDVLRTEGGRGLAEKQDYLVRHAVAVHVVKDEQAGVLAQFIDRDGEDPVAVAHRPVRQDVARRNRGDACARVLLVVEG